MLKSEENEHEMALHLCGLLNASGDISELITLVIGLLQKWSGCEAVGIRLKDGDDYPYYQTKGFPESFVISEDSLCTTDKNGQVIRDTLGNPVLECMCGNVICGRFDPKMPFFTRNGSFWTNSTTELLASTNECDRMARTRNRCNGEDYESVALVPLRAHGKTLGLIQLNDSRKGLFTVDNIALFERLGNIIAIILAQQQSNKVILQNEKKLDSIFRAAPIGIGVVQNRVITNVNSRMCEITGYSYEELVGSGSQIVYPNEDEFEYVGKEKYRQIAEKGSGTVETKFKRKNGAIIDVLLSSTPIDISDMSKGVTFTALDITDQKRAEKALRESEERLSLAMEASEYGFWDLDLDSNELCIGPTICAMNGYEPREQLPSDFDELAALVHPDDRKIFLEAIEDSIDQVKRVHFDFRLKCESGGWMWISCKGRPIDVDGNGRPHRFIGTHVDVTPRVKAEEALLCAKAAADESNRIQNEMLKNVTHELKTPLNVVLGFSDLLLNGGTCDLNASDRKYIEHIHNSGQKLLNMVNKILEFADIEHGNLYSLDLQYVNVADIVFETLNVFSKNASTKSVSIDTTIDQELDDVIADREKLKTILYNLVENAIKFTETGGSVTVEVRNGNGSVHFSVRDTGIGIAKERLEGIFDPFIQIDGSISRKYEGTGLGLALTRRLVQMHKGSIRVESEPGKGSNFVFEIPMIQE